MRTLSRPSSRSTAVLMMLVAAALGTASLSVPGAVAQPLPDLFIQKDTLENPPFSAGQFLHYTLFVQNQGADMAPGSTVVVRDLLSPGVELEFAFEGARTFEPHLLGVTCTNTTPDLFCEGPALVSGDFFIVIVRVKLPLSGKGTIINHAWVDPFEVVAESDETNNSAKFKLKLE